MFVSRLMCAWLCLAIHVNADCRDWDECAGDVVTSPFVDYICFSETSCINTTLIGQSEIECYGAYGCANSLINSTSSQIIDAYGALSITNTDIYQYGGTLTFSAFGYYTAYNTTIHCLGMIFVCFVTFDL